MFSEFFECCLLYCSYHKALFKTDLCYVFITCDAKYEIVLDNYTCTKFCKLRYKSILYNPNPMLQDLDILSMYMSLSWMCPIQLIVNLKPTLLWLLKCYATESQIFLGIAYLIQFLCISNCWKWCMLSNIKGF